MVRFAGHAALPRRIAVRSLAVIPPKMPSNSEPCASTHEAHSSRTRHRAHTALAGPSEPRLVGNHVTSGGASLQAASACQEGGSRRRRSSP